MKVHTLRLLTQLLNDERALARGEQSQRLDEFGGAVLVLKHIFNRGRGRQQDESPDVEREREKRDVAGRRAKRSPSSVPGVRPSSARPRDASATRRPARERGEKHVLQDERRPEESRQAAQQTARIERRKLIVPERPEEEERKYPAQQPRSGSTLLNACAEAKKSAPASARARCWRARAARPTASARFRRAPAHERASAEQRETSVTSGGATKTSARVSAPHAQPPRSATDRKIVGSSR